MIRLLSLILLVHLIACSGSGQEALFQKIEIGPLVETPSGSRSCNFLDVDNDGLEDILITNGTSGGEDNMLYLNLDGDEFQLLDGPVTNDNSPSDGSSCADYDNDGWIDIFTVNWYNVPNLLYQNDGTGAFIEIDTGLVSTSNTYSETASWGDADNDGLLDLYVTNSAGNRRNQLFRNTGTGYFEKLDDIVPTSDLDYSRNVTWTDYDMDGDMDIYVTNENGQVNDLYRNDGDFEFVKVLGNGLVLDALTTMSSSWADVDNDGDQDVFLANYDQDNQLFLNDGEGEFSSVEGPWEGGGGCSFSSNFADYDNDGDLDLFVTNGFCQTDLNNFLYENLGNGDFQQVMSEPMAIDSGSSYGCAWGDYNNDGFQDLIVANWQDETQSNYLYKNLGNSNHWLEMRLEGVQSNRSAIGAKVYCYAVLGGENVTQLREVSAQTGYCGQNSLIVHFGLGDATTVESIRIEWPSGIIQQLEGLEADQIVN
ncbi:MAG: CRTAC1 family protein, partial [Flavobacteriales bacterium]|nr:CRTAC1 family protein [Flavobacteriales bacterium]